MGEAVARPRAGRIDPGFWRGRRVFLTGHTGFIGGWTAAVLHGLGAELFGYALPPPTTPSFFDLTKLGGRLSGTVADLRDRSALLGAFEAARPDIVIHLAAQPLLGVGFASPVETFETNVMGTIHLLECIRKCGAGAVVVMTSDKVYLNSATDNREQDRLGASDPYGGSKVCCEVVAEVYAHTFLSRAGVPLATVRAGNVVGGGDWATDRLIPDAIRAFGDHRALSLRRPGAIRPWQHVLDAVLGMLLIAQHSAGGPAVPEAWNVGPPVARAMTVGEVAMLAATAWGDGARVVHDGPIAFPETDRLTLDSRRIRTELGFAESWDLPGLLARTIEWYRRTLAGSDAWALTRRQIDDYLASAGG